MRPSLLPLLPPDEAEETGCLRFGPGRAKMVTDVFQAIRPDREVDLAVDGRVEVDQALIDLSEVGAVPLCQSRDRLLVVPSVVVDGRGGEVVEGRQELAP